MASNKNQHFVPRCYLKAFSLQAEGFAINLYNINLHKGICRAPLKSQCSRDYFYGNDLRLERLLQGAESMYAQTLRDIVSPGYALNKDDKEVLRHFCYLQHCRTEAAVRQGAMFMSEIARIAGDDTIQGWRSVMKDVVLAGMRAFADTMTAVYDLKICLVRNRSGRPFITSDDPAVMTNRWYHQSPKAKRMNGGAGNSGALFFLPLTRDILCILYDGDVYNIENTAGWVTVSKESDIDAFNEHQILRCVSNLYFNDWEDLADIERAVAQILPRRPAARFEVIVAVPDGEDANSKRYRVVPEEKLVREGEAFFHIRGVPLWPSQWPSIIRWRPNPKIYSNGSATGFVRRWSLENGSKPGTGYRRIR